MEFFNGNVGGEMISIQDMIEHDIRSSVAEGLIPSRPQFVQSPSVDPMGQLNGSIVSIPASQTATTPCNTSLNGNHISLHNISGVELDSSGSLPNLSWLQNMNVSGLQQQAMLENTDPNLMVDPQTGLPINSAQTPQQHSQTHQLINGQQIQGQIVGYEIATDVTPVTFASSTPSPAIQYVTIQDNANAQSVYIAQTPVSLARALRTVPQGATSQFTLTTPSTTHMQGYSMTSTPTTVQHATVHLLKDEKQFPKPVYSYSCLIAMALKNSKTGSLPVSEIYNFMTSNFPYFKTAPDGWKNSVRHNLSLNKCFEKIENPKSNGNTRKGCLWAMNPAKIKKMDDEISKWNKKDPIAIRQSMANPDVLEILEKGQGQLLKGNQPTQNAPTVSSAQKMTSSSIKTESFTSLKESDVFMNQDILDSSLHLDPALSELALQNGLWDDEDLFHDLSTTSPISFSRMSSPPGFSSTSPIRLTPTGRAFQAVVT